MRLPLSVPALIPRGLALAAVALTLALWVPAGAFAEAEVSDPFSGTKNPSTETTASKPATATQETSPSSGGNTVLIVALVAGGLLLGGIAFVIMRDARSVAPVVDGPMTRGTRNPQGRQRQRRAQAKRAKQQRKQQRRS